MGWASNHHCLHIQHCLCHKIQESTREIGYTCFETLKNNGQKYTYFTFVNIVFLNFIKLLDKIFSQKSKACVDIDARKNNFNNFNKQWLFDKIGESSEWIVKSSHHRDPSSHIVPQSKEVDDPGQQHPSEYHPKCQTSHVSRGVALLIGHMCSRVSSTASLVQSEDQSIIKITLQLTFT